VGVASAGRGEQSAGVGPAVETRYPDAWDRSPACKTLFEPHSTRLGVRLMAAVGGREKYGKVKEGGTTGRGKEKFGVGDGKRVGRRSLGVRSRGSRVGCLFGCVPRWASMVFGGPLDFCDARGRRLMMGEVKTTTDRIQCDGWCGLQICRQSIFQHGAAPSYVSCCLRQPPPRTNSQLSALFTLCYNPLRCPLRITRFTLSKAPGQGLL
jgi:hypothetical protein